MLARKLHCILMIQFQKLLWYATKNMQNVWKLIWKQRLVGVNKEQFWKDFNFLILLKTLIMGSIFWFFNPPI
mgnify:CR=1 FL=1